jgi:hypothetical protein
MLYASISKAVGNIYDIVLQVIFGRTLNINEYIPLFLLRFQRHVYNIVWVRMLNDIIIGKDVYRDCRSTTPSLLFIGLLSL